MTLLARYETLRRKETETLSGLIDTLNKVDGLPADQIDQARDALLHADHPFLVVLLGGFNTGKSSLLNALIGDQALGVGATPTTDRIIVLRHGAALERRITGDTDTVFHPSKLLEQVSLVDSPGLESVFKGHDAITRRYLHRADAVFLVMLATQAMSQTNAGYLESLRAYGTRVIIIVNQIDLLDEAERAQVRDFVTTQAKAYFDHEPEVWLVSAKLAAQSRPNGASQPRDAALWEASGFGQIERFILQTLGDAERIRAKLSTPLQIARNVSTHALAQIKVEQTALADYRKSAQNVRSQIAQAVTDQTRLTDQTALEIGGLFDESAKRGQAAIHEVFQIGRAPRLAGGGIMELIGLARLARGLGQRTPTKAAFETAKVTEPFERLPALVESLAPRLEGRDVKDTDDLVIYARKELERLPDTLRGKLVGLPVAQTSYDRTLIPAVSGALTEIVKRAKAVEFERIDRAVQSTVIVLAIYELAVFILAIAFAASFGGSTQGGGWIALVLLTLGLMGAGLLVMPLRGRLMSSAFAARLSTARQDYLETLKRATSAQIAYGERMRQDAVTPFLRLVDAQTGQVDALQTELERHQQSLSTLEKELTGLGG